MNTVRKITNELSIAGQPRLDELQRWAEDGYQSVVNLRSPDEIGFLDVEQQKMEYLGLCYVNIPIQMKDLNLNNLFLLTQKLVRLPKPTLIHCDSGFRSSIVVLMQIATEQGMSAEDAFQKVTKLGLLNQCS